MVTTKHISIVLLFILASVSLLAATEAEFMPVSITNGREVTHFDYKSKNDSHVITTTKLQEWCTVKPDNLDDGWMDCEFIFEHEHQNAVLSMISSPEVTLAFRDNTIRNIRKTFSDTYIVGEKIYYNGTLRNETNRIVYQKKKFSDFIPFPASIAASRYAIKITFQAPKYSSNSFSYTLSDSAGKVIAAIDPHFFCGELSTSGTYTLDQNLNPTNTCFVIKADNVILNGAGYTITSNGTGIGVESDDHKNIMVKNFAGITNFSAGLRFSHTSNVTFFNNTVNENKGYGFVVDSTISSNLTSNTVARNSQYAFLVINSSHNHFESNSAFNNSGYGGFYIGSDSRHNLLLSNTIFNNTDDHVGIFVQLNSNNTLRKNVVYNTGWGIQLSVSENNTIIDNSVYNTSKFAFQVTFFSFGNNLSSNKAYHSRYGFNIEGGAEVSEHNTLFNNTAYNNSIYGFFLNAKSHNNTLTNNIAYNNTGSNFYLFNSSGNTLESNSITATNEYGIRLNGSSDNNVFINNNIISDSFEILDETNSSTINVVVYNNSFGEIRWISESFLKNITINVNNDLGIGLNRNLFIGNNTAALNTTGIAVGNINSSANITLRGLDLNQVNRIRRLETFSTSSSEIINSGSNCDGISCEIIGYNGGAVLFNTTSFSSFAAHDLLEVKVYNLSRVFTNSTAYAAFRFFIKNIAAYENLFNWTFNTGESTIQSTLKTNLTSNESVMVFVEHNYTSPEIYTIVVNGTTAEDFDLEEISVTVG